MTIFMGVCPPQADYGSSGYPPEGRDLPASSAPDDRGRNFKRNEYQEPGAADKKRVCEGIAGSLLQFTELIWLG